MSGKAASIRVTFLKNMMLIVMTALFLWGAAWIHDDHSAFRVESDALREEHLASRKTMLQEQVSHAVDYIEYMKGQTEKRLKAEIRERVNEAWQVASHLYEENREVRSAEDIREMIRDALRPIRFNDDRGYYFALALNGVVELRADHSGLEGVDMLRFGDAKESSVVREMIDLVQKSGEGYYHYDWTKPNAPDRNYPKIAFLKLFEPYGWILGTGEYLDDVASEIKTEVLDRLVNLRFGAEGYFFGSTYQGDPLFSNGKLTRGTGSVWDLTDPDGVRIIQAQYRVIKDQGSGFVRYVWPKLHSTKPSPKISYVAGIEDWEWIIGAGVYIDTIEQKIAENEILLRNGLKKKLLKSALLLLVLFLLILYWARLISDRIRKSLLSFSTSFRKAAGESTPIDTRGLHFSEFREIAEFANQMLRAREDAEKALRESEEKLRHAHKMEAVGTLAGGIAHEFNNVLGIILGNTELAMEDVGSSQPARRHLARIESASLRARDVVRQLLNFSRMSNQGQQPVRVQEIIRDALKVLRASIPKSIRIETIISERAGPILGDPGRIHQLLLNLCANSAQAMDAGGVLTIRLTDTRAETAALSGEPGRKWIRLTVSDTGHGIAPEIRDRIFDPYFTTREQG